METKKYTAPGSKVIVILDPAEEVSAGGVIIPDNAREKAVRATVVSVGPEVREALEQADYVLLKDGYAGAAITSRIVSVEPEEILAVLG